MSHTVGIHAIVLRTGVDGKKFENFMTEEAFPTAAEVPGSVNRAGHSSIESQHLLKNDGEAKEYLWLVKSTGVFDLEEFSRVFNNMFEEVREKLEGLATHKAASLFTVVASLDVGPRDELGRPRGGPTRGSDI